MRYLLAITLLFSPTLANAGNHGCRVASPYLGVGNHSTHYAQKVVAVATPYYFAVGQNTQIEAQVARATQPLLDEIKALREEQAAFRQEAKAGFSSLSAKFSFRGQGTFTVEGDGGGDTPVVPVDPGPGPVEPPSVDAAPALTPAMAELFASKCAKCHTDKAEGFNVGAKLTAADASEILTRVLSADPAIQMPPRGSSESDRATVVGWVFGSELKSSEATIKQRKGQK